MKREFFIILGILLFLSAGMTSYFYFETELARALRIMDTLDSMTLTISSTDRVYIDGNNVNYSFLGESDYFCHFGSDKTDCYDPNGYYINTLEYYSPYPEAGLGFSRFTNLLEYDWTLVGDSYETGYIDFSQSSIKLKLKIVGNYVVSISFIHFGDANTWIDCYFTKLNETVVTMPDIVTTGS